jgi:hypothetical protein
MLPVGRGRRGLTVELLEDRLSPATLTVNSTADTANPSDPWLTLREAIAIVNSPTLPDGLSDQILAQIQGTLNQDGTDTIAFDPSAVTGPITLGGTALMVTLPSSTASVTIEGGSGVTVDGNDASVVLVTTFGVDATLDHLTISHGRGGFGGGISNAGTLAVRNSTFSSNFATVNGAGLFSNFAGVLTVDNCTFIGNGGSQQGLEGGGLQNDGLATVSNSTFASNVADFGGGIENNGILTVRNSTLSCNSATQGGGIFLFNQGSSLLRLENTIVAGNSSRGPADGPDIQGAVNVVSGYNWIGVGDGSSGLSDGVNYNRIGTSVSPLDPLLAPLDDYGGPTQTFALLPGSPALNIGDPFQVGTPDQRGVVRRGGVNIGAFQASAASFVITGPGTATAGVAFDISVAAVDIFGQLAVGYTGRVVFFTTDRDPRVVLPPDTTFGASDGGVVTFPAGVTLFTSGDQTLTVTSIGGGSGITGSTTVTL